MTTDFPVPKEGDEVTQNGKTLVWTKRVDGTCTIFDWIEKKAPPVTYDHIGNYTDYSDIYF